MPLSIALVRGEMFHHHLPKSGPYNKGRNDIPVTTLVIKNINNFLPTEQSPLRCFLLVKSCTPPRIKDI